MDMGKLCSQKFCCSDEKIINCEVSWLELLMLREILTKCPQCDGVGQNHAGERADNLILGDLEVGISPGVMLTQNQPWCVSISAS